MNIELLFFFVDDAITLKVILKILKLLHFSKNDLVGEFLLFLMLKCPSNYKVNKKTL
jgi:hypothetical protein